MNFFLSIYFISIVVFGYSQINIVPNSSFEDVPSCPSYCVAIECAPPWVNPTEFGSPDLFNLCNANWFNAINEYQLPRSGTGYAGFYTGEQYTDLPNVYDAMEYIQTALNDTMSQDVYYLVEYYLSLAEFGRYATNNVGVYFSDTAIYRSGIGHEFMLLDYPEQILPFGNPIILDTADNFWYKVQAVYQAIGNEKYMTIGNFNSDSETTYQYYIPLTNSMIGIGDEAYYFIDDISVIPIDSIPGGLPANAGPDQTIYIQDSVFIGQKIANLNCNWYELGGAQIASNTSGLYVQPLQTTTYVVEQILGTDISYDTCTVFVEGLGLEEKLESQIVIYPNPATESFTVISENAIIQKIELLNLTSQVVQEKIVQSKQIQLNIETLSKGIYFVKIYSEEGIVMEQVVVE